MMPKGDLPGSKRPPRSIDDLTRWIGPNGDAVLGKRAHAALTKMLQAPHLAAVQSISEIASNNNVDPSTLTRLGKRLGFHGFTGLQDLFRNHVVQRTGYYSDRTQKLLTKKPEGGSDLARLLAEEEVKNVHDTIYRITDKTIEKAVSLIVNARRVYVLGLRASFSFAHFFAYHLGFMGQDVMLLGGAGFTVAEDLAHLTERDVLVVVSFRPYATVTVSAAKFAASRGVPLVAITDLGSPYGEAGKKCVEICVASAVYFNQSLSSLLLVELLLAAVAKKVGPSAVQAIQDLELQLRKLDIEAP
jgi:DNA-binding MurR/RpiR family transcriptional regulator